MPRIVYEKNKNLAVRESGNSADYIGPVFDRHCVFNCSYCYAHRYRRDAVYIYNNVDEILEATDLQLKTVNVTKPNQTDPEYVTVDISCNADYAQHNKFHDWKKVFEWYKNHPRLKGTLATKAIPKEYLSFNPERKIRIRFSLMPQKISTILEPNTPQIVDRIQAIDSFIEAGYDVHVNFSPVVVYNGWLEDYKDLFELVNQTKYKDIVKCEVIFLTHNDHKHKLNLEQGSKGENLLWVPDLQEHKISKHGGRNLRYKLKYKRHFVNQFKELHNQVIPWCTIRYIF